MSELSKVTIKHQTDNWKTPADLFGVLDDEFHFTLDPCASHDSHLCNKYYTPEEDGLKQSWGGETVFCNPPYSEAAKWVEKAFYESRADNTTVVMLIPSRTDTSYFHNFILHRTEIRFVSGRLQFGNSKRNAPFSSMIVIFRGATRPAGKMNADVVGQMTWSDMRGEEDEDRDS